MVYAVVIMDIVGSRRVKERERLQKRLQSCIDEVNEGNRSVLAAPISITAGDEWQLLTDRPGEAYRLTHEFQRLFWGEGLEIYGGIGVGPLSTELHQQVSMMDGPCFHLARKALEVVKNPAKSKNRYIFSNKNRVFFLACEATLETYKKEFSTEEMGENRTRIRKALTKAAAILGEEEKEDLPLEKVINTLIENTEILISRMTQKQRKIYKDYLRMGSYRKIVESYGRISTETPAGISQKLNSAEYFTIQRNHNMISLLLSYYGGKRSGAN